MSDAVITPPVAHAKPTTAALFMGFLSVGIIGFGGVLPLARQMVVEQRRWLSGSEFTDLLALCQFLPGGNAINLAAAVGLRFRGPLGACAALAGLMAAPVVIVILLGMVYARFQHEPLVRRLFAGLAAGAAGLLVALACKIAAPLWRRPVGAGVAVLCFVAIAALHWPLLPTMLVMAPLSVLVAWQLRA
ncbi:chromate transporter [Limobrevibacterium gyesilva]|uniref:Chromate transporter n=1 Tax=Limobrevibacterium gyesilva TaxID=2991712 RepID=A0AA41YNX1_9PROT|nr:chromate transporter [Limobrevibacterium gyesilva]MCW3476190.1 chromate transporter [Limobrevibacterium gyesilva]